MLEAIVRQVRKFANVQQWEKVFAPLRISYFLCMLGNLNVSDLQKNFDIIYR